MDLQDMTEEVMEAIETVALNVDIVTCEDLSTGIISVEDVDGGLWQVQITKIK